MFDTLRSSCLRLEFALIPNRYCTLEKREQRCTINRLSSTTNKRHGTPLAKHFNERDHSIEDFRITGIERPKKDNIISRRQRDQVDKEDGNGRKWRKRKSSNGNKGVFWGVSNGLVRVFSRTDVI